jgi:hypothetical protein
MPVQFDNSALPDIIELKNINQVYFNHKTKQDPIKVNSSVFLENLVAVNQPSFGTSQDSKNPRQEKS